MEINALRHTGAHLLAAAIKSIYPNVRLGTSHDNGVEFSYDFDFATPIKTDDLIKISAEMERILKLKPKMEVTTKTRGEARKVLQSAGEVYKIELLNDIPAGEKITFYKMDKFADLCAGPHIENVDEIKCFKLTKITGAYWRADDKNKMLTRIYGVAFKRQSELDEYNQLQEEIKRRDHNKVGREQEIFTTVDCIGQGLPLFMPKGAKLFQILSRFVEDESEKRGYQFTRTPYFAKRELYQMSGHWQHYKKDMFILGDEHFDKEVFAIRPMTCPFQYFVYKNSIKSYRDLPIRYAETSPVARNEASGEMHGLIRVRQFTQSDNHVICRPDQIQKCFDEVLDLICFFTRVLGIDKDIYYRLSKGDPANKEKYIGDEKTWKTSEDEIRKALVRRKVKFFEADGEAAFYGPKVDIQFRNVYGKEDSLLTAQLDFGAAERFDMFYIDENGEKARPFVIHHTTIGCYERTIAMLIEKYAGSLPVWLCPTQAVIIGITNAHDEYVDRVYTELTKNGVRIQKDTRNEKVGYKIREHTIARTPYILVAGDKEIVAGAVAVRTREGTDLGQMKIEKFAELVAENCKECK
jgi:threonyl-tRNA synthetase